MVEKRRNETHYPESCNTVTTVGLATNAVKNKGFV
jgi:hypothetical protein